MTSHASLLKEKVARDREALADHLSAQFAGRRTVFTNGVFDLLHSGHVDYLCRARDLGDLLIVGVNSDESVRRLGKGPERPINAQADRMLVLAGLGCVDFVVGFGEDTPARTLEILQPGIHCKGGDYRPEDLPEGAVVRSYGGEIAILPFVTGYSTTAMVRRLQT